MGSDCTVSALEIVRYLSPASPLGIVTLPELVLMQTRGLWPDWSSVQVARGKSSPMRWQSPWLGPGTVKLISKAWGRRTPWQQCFGNSELPRAWPAPSYQLLMFLSQFLPSDKLCQQKSHSVCTKSFNTRKIP